MATKKKINVKAVLKNAEVKNGKKVNKPEPEIIKRRGVQKGAKRGSYKKHKDFLNANIETLNHEHNNNTSNNTNDDTNINDPQILPDQKIETNNKGDENYAKFLSEYGAPTELIESIETDVQKNEVQTENKEFDFTGANNVPNNNQPNTQNNNLNDVKKPFAALVNGYMLLALCDFIFPGIILWAYKKYDKRAEKIKISNCKLDKDQKESLMEAANQVAQVIFQQMNPIIVLVVGMGVMYWTNISGELDRIPKSDEPDKKKMSLTLIKEKPVVTPVKKKGKK